MSCENVPTTAEIAQAKDDIGDFNAFMTSTSDTFIDSNGVSRLTLQGAIISIGWSPVGEFATGFTYTNLNDVGRDASGSWWRYNGSDLPKVITAGTVPSSPNFSVISFETADNVQWESGKSVGYALDDLQGFTDELLAQAGIVDDGQPDELGNSQRVEAIKKITDGLYSRAFSSVNEMASCKTLQVGQRVSVISKNKSRDYVITPDKGIPVFGGARADLSVDKRLKKPELISHRCVTTPDGGDQNTLLGLQTVINLGIKYIEIDCQVSSDGIVYVYHDTDVSSRTNGTGAIPSLTSTYIDSLKLTAYSGAVCNDVRIPRLSEFIDVAKRGGINLIIEQWGSSSLASTDSIVSTIKSLGYESKCTITCYGADIAILHRVAATSNIGVGVIGSGVNVDLESTLALLNNYGGGWLIWLGSDLLADPSIIALANEYDVSVAGYTVKDKKLGDELFAIGAFPMSDILL